MNDSCGIAMLVAVVEAVIKRAGVLGIIAVDDDGNYVYSIKSLRRSDVSQNDVAQRVYNGISWTITIGYEASTKARCIFLFEISYFVQMAFREPTPFK